MRLRSARVDSAKGAYILVAPEHDQPRSSTWIGRRTGGSARSHSAAGGARRNRSGRVFGEDLSASTPYAQAGAPRTGPRSLWVRSASCPTAPVRRTRKHVYDET